MRPEPAAVGLGDLAHSLGFLLRLAQIEAYARLFAGGTVPDLHLVETSILRVIHLNPGIRQGLLAKALRIKRAHMTKIVQGLEGQGLLTTSVPPGDRRSVELSLTGAGLARMQALVAVLDPREAEVPAGLTAREAETLRRLLRKYLAIPDPSAPPQELLP